MAMKKSREHSGFVIYSVHLQLPEMQSCKLGYERDTVCQ